jgi:hypothetical protein
VSTGKQNSGRGRGNKKRKKKKKKKKARYGKKKAMQSIFFV